MAHLKNVSMVLKIFIHFRFAVYRVDSDKVISTFTTVFIIEQNVTSVCTRALLRIVSYLMRST